MRKSSQKFSDARAEFSACSPNYNAPLKHRHMAREARTAKFKFGAHKQHQVSKAPLSVDNFWKNFRLNRTSLPTLLCNNITGKKVNNMRISSVILGAVLTLGLTSFAQANEREIPSPGRPNVAPSPERRTEYRRPDYHCHRWPRPGCRPDSRRSYCYYHPHAPQCRFR